MAVIEFYKAGHKPILLATIEDSVVPPKHELIAIGYTAYEVVLINWSLRSIPGPNGTEKLQKLYAAVHLDAVRESRTPP